MDIKCVINDVKNGKSYSKAVDSGNLMGRKIGEVIPGNIFGLVGYEMRITGGSDSAGFPMKKELEGGWRKKMLLKKGNVGAYVKRKGGIVRKTVRGNLINEFTAQVNLKVSKYGTKKVEELLGKEKKEVKEEKKVEEKPKVEKKKEVKKEEPKKE